ncbi:MAG: hypothetical protein Q4D95_03580 [Peptoniphilus sp.]|nr:hypothetical protein [Peptoniphilus sp.]
MLKKISFTLLFICALMLISTNFVNAQTQENSFEGLTKNEYEEKIDRKITDEEWDEITNHGETPIIGAASGTTNIVVKNPGYWYIVPILSIFIILYLIYRLKIKSKK